MKPRPTDRTTSSALKGAWTSGRSLEALTGPRNGVVETGDPATQFIPLSGTAIHPSNRQSTHPRYCDPRILCGLTTSSNHIDPVQPLRHTHYCQIETPGFTGSQAIATTGVFPAPNLGYPFCSHSSFTPTPSVPRCLVASSILSLARVPGNQTPRFWISLSSELRSSYIALPPGRRPHSPTSTLTCL